MPEREPPVTAGAAEPVRGGRRGRGIVHDPRQGKFEF